MLLYEMLPFNWMVKFLRFMKMYYSLKRSCFPKPNVGNKKFNSKGGNAYS